MRVVMMLKQPGGGAFVGADHGPTASVGSIRPRRSIRGTHNHTPGRVVIRLGGPGPGRGRKGFRWRWETRTGGSVIRPGLVSAAWGRHQKPFVPACCRRVGVKSGCSWDAGYGSGCFFSAARRPGPGGRGIRRGTKPKRIGAGCRDWDAAHLFVVTAGFRRCAPEGRGRGGAAGCNGRGGKGEGENGGASITPASLPFGKASPRRGGISGRGPGTRRRIQALAWNYRTHYDGAGCRRCCAAGARRKEGNDACCFTDEGGARGANRRPGRSLMKVLRRRWKCWG